VSRRSRRRRQASQEVTFEEVVSIVEAWQPEFKSYTVAKERMQVYLDRRLNPDPIDGQRADVRSPPGPTNCDIVVDGRIGVNVYRSFSKQQYNDFRALVNDCEQEYIVMWAHTLPIDDHSKDQWEYARSRYTGRQADVKDVQFVHCLPEESSQGWLQELLQYPEAMLFAVLSVVISVALLLGSASGSRSIVGGPVTTGVVSLVLIVLLVLLWGANR
jgi:hypothetical protein